MEYVKPECLLIDLASNPGGIDKKAAKRKRITVSLGIGITRKSCTNNYS